MAKEFHEVIDDHIDFMNEICRKCKEKKGNRKMAEKQIIVPKDYVMPREQELAFELLNKSVLLNQILQMRMLSDKMKGSLEITVLKDHLEAAIIEFAKELVHLDTEEE